LLSILAIIIIAISFWYTNQLVKKIALDERQKVELWADAVRNRAVLVKYTDELFRKYKLEERKRAEIWAQAIRNLNTTEDNEARNFYLKVVSENTNIPALIVDQSGKINYHYNVDLDLIKGEEYLRLHKIMTNISTTSIWECLKNGDDIDKLLKDVPDEFYNKIQEYINLLRDKFNYLEAKI
jgi:hypothetical protein